MIDSKRQGTQPNKNRKRILLEWMRDYVARYSSSNMEQQSVGLAGIRAIELQFPNSSYCRVSISEQASCVPIDAFVVLCTLFYYFFCSCFCLLIFCQLCKRHHSPIQIQRTAQGRLLGGGLLSTPPPSRWRKSASSNRRTHENRVTIDASYAHRPIDTPDP